MKNYPYCSVIAIDVKGSEQFTDRGELEEKLNRMSALINSRFSHEVVINMQIKNGDELFGVFSSFTAGFRIFEEICILAEDEDLHLYFGLGIGKLETGTIQDPNRANGSGVIKAYRALEKIKQKKIPYTIPSLHVQFWALGEEMIPYEGINSMVYSVQEKEDHATPKQKKLYYYLKRNPELNQEELGYKLGYKEGSKSSISKLMTRSGYHDYNQIKSDLVDYLDKLQFLVENSESMS